MSYASLIADYLKGPEELRSLVADMTQEQLQARPIPGAWSTQQVICHLADFETVYADRMKRVLAEDNPPLLAGDPDQFAAALAYDQRDVQQELALIDLVRKQMAEILNSQTDDVFQRTGIHSADGALSLETLLRRITGHFPHHGKFIREKRAALGI